MDTRGAVRRLLEMQQGDADLEALEAHLDDTAIELLTALCHSLTLALAGATGTSTRRGQAREFLAECLAGIEMVLEVWEMADVEVVGGAYLDESALFRPLYD